MSKQKIGVGKTQPKGEARPLGTPRTKSAQAFDSRQKTRQTVDVSPATQKVLDTPATTFVDSQSVNQSVEPTTSKDRIMDVTLTRNAETRKSTSVVYNFPAGLRGSVRVSKSAFNGSIPDSLPIDWPLAEPRKAKASMTAEERKAARAAAPKLTLAEKIAKREKSLADLKAKADKQAQAANQPSL